jgi:hypothetical protein
VNTIPPWTGAVARALEAVSAYDFIRVSYARRAGKELEEPFSYENAPFS